MTLYWQAERPASNGTAMKTSGMNPLTFTLVCIAGWMNRRQQLIIDSLQEEVRILKEQLNGPPIVKEWSIAEHRGCRRLPVRTTLTLAKGHHMPHQESDIERLEEQFPPMSGTAFAEARARVLASGQSLLQSENGSLYEVFPDGRKVFQKRLEPPTSVTPGTRINIR